MWHDVLLCHHYLQVLGSSSYQRGNSLSSKSYLFLEFRRQVWKLCEAGVATQFLDSNLWTSRHSLIQGLKILTQITIRFLILVNFSTKLYIIYHQATITLGYILSPLVMRRVNTRPQVQSQRTDQLSFFKKHFGLRFGIDHKYFGIRVAEFTQRAFAKKFAAPTFATLSQY